MQQPGQVQRSGIDVVVQGRIVWGGVKAQTKMVYGTRTPAIDPKTGKEIIEYVFGLAIPKPSPQSNQHEIANFQTIWNAICSEGARIGFQQPGAPGFHWKFDDGDGRKADGSEYPAHSKGCIILACKTRIPLKLMAWENGKCVQVTEDQIKCGDYVQVALNVCGHGNPNAGLYINPSFVARFAYGEEIKNQVDPTTIFGATPPPMPVGGSATPIGGGFIQAPGFNQGVPSTPTGAPVQFNPTNALSNVPGFGQPGQYQLPNMGAPQQPAYQPHTAILPDQFQQPAGQVHGGMVNGSPVPTGPAMPAGYPPAGGQPSVPQGFGAPMGGGFMPPGYNGQ